MSLVDRAHDWLLEKPRRADLAALATLSLLWALFFWRALTPNPADQVSLPEGDFSGQFVAFGAYQARRLLAGQVPLWNPYNFAGHPFLADTQSAVFYPPRLVTIFVSPAFGGWSYAALQAEALAHFWLASLLTYLFVRTITDSRLAGLVGGLTLAYGGYLTGYPPLQLAVLEAGVWLPLALLGVYKASERPKWRIGWLALSGLALGLSLLAGHPQTSLFFTYALVAYIVHRAARTRMRPLDALLMLGLTLVGGYGLAMVQVLPGLEYARLTTRADLGYQALSAGFPLRDLAIFLVPNVFTVWSPLYSGVAGLTLAVLSVWRGEQGARFWAVIALVALGLSFGGGTLLYPLAYLVAPGFNWFRGQERAAYLVAHSVAIMAGLGAANMLRWEAEQGRQFVRFLGWASGAAWAFAAIALACACSPINEARPSLSEGAIFLAVLVTLTWAVTGLRGVGGRAWMPLLVGLVVFDLFSNDMQTNFEPVPLAERDLSGPLVDAALDYQRQAGLMRVDGWAGLGGNGGTLVGLQDIRGISPLRLAALDGYFGLPLYRLHQLLAVELVFTDWQQLEVPSQVIAEARDGDPPLYLHRIEEPMPRAWLAFEAATVADDAQALGLLAEPAFDVRRTVLLTEEPPLEMPSQPPDEWHAEVVDYQPERIAIQTEADANSLLVLSELYYPGWRATLDGEPTRILRADAGLRAVAVPAGEHVVTMVYCPTSFYVGAGISLATALTLAAVTWRGDVLRRARISKRSPSVC
jgi:hypothetical protein